MPPPQIPTLVLMCGLPGSGKTTRARHIARHMPALRLCPDEWMSDLGVDLHDQAFRDRLEKRLWGLAQEALPLGHSIIMESGFWVRAERDEKRQTARTLGAGVVLEFLDIPAEELVRRLAVRNGQAGAAHITRAQLMSWVPLFQAPTADELALFDPLPSAGTYLAE